MLADDLTTWAEFEHSPRSDCHGWSTCPINEIVTQVHGVRPVIVGSQRLRIEPQVELLYKTEGKFVTPLGEVKLKWEEDSWKWGFLRMLRQRLGSGGPRILRMLWVGGRKHLSKRRKFV
jgi:hypothetical protein